MLEHLQLQARIDILQQSSGRPGLVLAQRALHRRELAVHIRLVEPSRVHDYQLADAEAGQRRRLDAARPAKAGHEYLRIAERLLLVAGKQPDIPLIELPVIHPSTSPAIARFRFGELRLFHCQHLPFGSKILLFAPNMSFNDG